MAVSLAALPNDGLEAWLVEADIDDASGTEGGSVAATNAATSLTVLHSSRNCKIGGVRSP